MTIERCPRCQGRMMPDREDGKRCFSCGHTPPPLVLLGIPEETKVRRREPMHNNSRL